MGQTPLITRSEIRSIFSTSFYTRGKRYYEEGRVNLLRPDDNNPRGWLANVHGNRMYSVSVTLGTNEIQAGCTCPAFGTYDECKHVVSVLIALADASKSGNTAVRDSAQAEVASTATIDLTAIPNPASQPTIDGKRTNEKSTNDYASSARLIDLFRTMAAQNNRRISPDGDPSSEELLVEWICHPTSFSRESISLAMKVGPKNTYVVKKIREFLETVDEVRRHFFTPKFTYDPAVHRFSAIDFEIVHILLNVIRDESNYRNLFGYYSMTSAVDRDKSLWIPPRVWESLYPLLLKANTTVDHAGHKDTFRIDDTPPISARISSRKDGDYALRLSGVKDLHVFPSYGCAIRGTTFYPLDASMVDQIEVVKRIVDSEKRSEIAIPPEALDPVVNEVLPNLRRVGRISMDNQISKRIVEVPLEAKLYLDWWNEDGEDDGALLARVEFVYGDFGFHPTTTGQQADANAAHEASNTIVLRDFAAEQRVLHLLEQAWFIQAQAGDEFLLFGEDDIYAFLFEKLPEIQEIAQVYATSAVDVRTKPSPSPRSRVDLDARTNWLEISFDIAGLDEGEIRDVLKSLVERKKYHRLRDGSFVSLEQGAYAEFGQVLDNLGLRQSDLRGNKRAGSEAAVENSGVTLRLPALRALPLMDVQATGLGPKFGKSLRQWLDNLRNPDNLDAPVPTDLKATLREYQAFGFQWMKTLAKYRFGGILADDMGLGKTIQSIAFLLSDKEEQELSGTTAHNPALIVCPASLTYNWLHEIETFAPSLKAVVVAGDRAERLRILSSTEDVDVLVTSYPLLRRDADEYGSCTFRTLILDEAQAIKNHGTQTAQAARSIQSDIRFALTGTPIENSLDDLWSIFHTLFPDLLSSHKIFSSLSPEVVAKRVRPFILRRLKKDVLTELPEKIETLQTSDLTSEQKKLYLAYLSRLQQDTIEGLANEGFQKGRLRILAGLTRLRQICCHPSLCTEDYSGQSGKLEQLMELVQEYMASNQRMLIFSQFTSMLHIIRQVLTENGIDYFYLDGDTPVKERLKLCQSFNEGSTPIFLISLKAGGTGLNLTGADTVILYDLWWNPAVEQQAADRAHRMGQKRIVQVIRMVTKGTIEEKMYELQKRKRDLIDTVVQAGSEGLSTLSEEDVRELLMI